MNVWGPSVVLYLVIGVGVACALYTAGTADRMGERWFLLVTALPFWPLYLPGLLASRTIPEEDEPAAERRSLQDDMALAIAQVDKELAEALHSLDGWAEGVLSREKGRFRELQGVWSAQAERIREMDRLLALPESRGETSSGDAFLVPSTVTSEPNALNDRLRHSFHVRRQNLDRLNQVRRRAYEDLMGTLAWVRELVSMIHLAKYTGAPASRAEELVAQIAAAVEGLSEITWQAEAPVPAVDNI